MVKVIVIYISFFLLIPMSGNAAIEKLDVRELAQTREIVYSQQELADFVKKNLTIDRLEIVANENWKIIDMNLEDMQSRIIVLKFVNFNSNFNKIIGVNNFLSQQSRLGNNEALWIQFHFDTTNKNNIASSTLTLPISENCPKIGRLDISGYDSLNVPFSFMSKIIFFRNPINFSEESFKNLIFNSLSIAYDLNLNKKVAEYIGFYNESTSLQLRDTLYSKHSYWYSPHYEIEVECSDSLSFDHFFKTSTPSFLATPNSEYLVMTIAGFPLNLEFKRTVRSSLDKRNYKNIKCINNLSNHTFIIKEISKIDYTRCVYSPKGGIPCKDLRLFDRTKDLTIWFYNQSMLERIAIRWCLRKNKNLIIKDINTY